MPVTPTYPGVYIEEIPSGVRTIVGVATSVAAFIDFFARGPMNEATQIFNMGDFQRIFGGLHPRSEASYAIQQFFLNGGSEAWVVRVASGAFAASRAYIDNVTTAAPSANEAAASAAAVLIVTAIDPGIWGDNVRVQVDRSAAGFDLRITEYQAVGGTLVPVRQEVFHNLSMVAADPRFVDKIVNDETQGSELVRVTAQTANPPLANGTYSAPHAPPMTVTFGADPEVLVEITGTGLAATAAPLNLAAGTYGLAAAGVALEDAIRAAQAGHPAFSGARVDVTGDRLRVLAGPGFPNSRVLITQSGSSTAADALLFDNVAGSTVNLQEYRLGAAGVQFTGQLLGIAGADGLPPDGSALIGSLNAKTGMYALEDVDLFNLLCIPRTAIVSGPDALSATEASAVITEAEVMCDRRRAMFLMDTPNNIDEPTEIKAWLAANDTLRRKNAALYYPRVNVPDPLDGFKLRTIGASGTMAGVCARTDAARGVWKAPAGIEATLNNATALDYVLTDAENGTLNPIAINCLRSFAVYGNICWGARTLVGADQLVSDWKYVPVRRLGLFLEETLYRGTKWVVFEPNDEPLWAQIRLNVGAFLHTLFRQGAFQGQTPREAYFVKCDKETTTQNDINLGIVNIVVGFAPLKPAEFVIIKIQQIAGDVQT